MTFHKYIHPSNQYFNQNSKYFLHSRKFSHASCQLITNFPTTTPLQATTVLIPST